MLAGMNAIAGVATGQAATVTGSNQVAGGIGGPAKQNGSAPFSDLLGDAIGDVSKLETEVQKTMEGLMTGSGVDVHQAMIATQKASMAFELSLAVRNKAIQAYQQVMGMQF
jgi:flagellar hook-basal body complex protein FliE